MVAIEFSLTTPVTVWKRKLTNFGFSSEHDYPILQDGQWRSTFTEWGGRNPLHPALSRYLALACDCWQVWMQFRLPQPESFVLLEANPKIAVQKDAKIVLTFRKGTGVPNLDDPGGPARHEQRSAGIRR